MKKYAIEKVKQGGGSYIYFVHKLSKESRSLENWMYNSLRKAKRKIQDLVIDEKQDFFWIFDENGNEIEE